MCFDLLQGKGGGGFTGRRRHSHYREFSIMLAVVCLDWEVGWDGE